MRLTGWCFYTIHIIIDRAEKVLKFSHFIGEHKTYINVKLTKPNILILLALDWRDILNNIFTPKHYD